MSGVRCPTCYSDDLKVVHLYGDDFTLCRGCRFDWQTPDQKAASTEHAERTRCKCGDVQAACVCGEYAPARAG